MASEERACADDCRRGIRADLTAFLLSLAALAGIAARRPRQFRQGTASWIWYVSAAAEVVRRSGRSEASWIDAVYVKSADGIDPWEQFTPGSSMRSTIVGSTSALGNSFTATIPPGGPRRRRGSRCRRRLPDHRCREQLRGSLRGGGSIRPYAAPAHRRRFPVALSSFPSSTTTRFPYSSSSAPGGDTTCRRSTGTRSGARHQRPRPHLPLQPPLRWDDLPVGQTYDTAHRQLEAFRRSRARVRARGVSWWSWQERQPVSGEGSPDTLQRGEHSTAA